MPLIIHSFFDEADIFSSACCKPSCPGTGDAQWTEKTKSLLLRTQWERQPGNREVTGAMTKVKHDGWKVES